MHPFALVACFLGLQAHFGDAVRPQTTKIKAYENQSSTPSDPAENAFLTAFVQYLNAADVTVESKGEQKPVRLENAAYLGGYYLIADPGGALYAQLRSSNCKSQPKRIGYTHRYTGGSYWLGGERSKQRTDKGRSWKIPAFNYLNGGEPIDGFDGRNIAMFGRACETTQDTTWLYVKLETTASMKGTMGEHAAAMFCGKHSPDKRTDYSGYVTITDLHTLDYGAWPRGNPSQDQCSKMSPLKCTSGGKPVEENQLEPVCQYPADQEA